MIDLFGQRSSSWLALLALLAPFPALSGPVPTPDFSGTWKLDVAHSGDMTAILEIVGLSWFERLAVQGIAVTQTISQSADELRIEIHAAFLTRRERLRTDGHPTPLTDPNGTPVLSRTTWTPDHRALVTDTSAVLADGERVPLKMTRSISADGRLMYVVNEARPPGTEPIVVTRVFERE